MIKNNNLKYWSRNFIGLTALLLSALGIMILILSLPMPARVVNILSRFNISYWTHLCTLVIFYIAFRRKGWLGNFYPLILIAGTFALFLGYFWNTGYSVVTQLWGYLPTSDTSTYYIEASELLAGDKLTGPASYRPLFTVLLSTLLSLVKLNTINAFIVLVFLNAIAIYLAANEVRKTHGALAAAFHVLACSWFYRFYVGTFMTEQIGLLLGNVAFALFWNGISNHKKNTIFFGIFALSLGLNFRAGALIILVTIPLWVGLSFAHKRFSIKWATVAFALAMSGFILHFAAAQLFLPKGTPTFSNFGYTLYGVAVGNKGWMQIVEDYPNIVVTQATGIAIRQIASDPLLFLKGVAKAYRDYINPVSKGCNAFCFTRLYNLEKHLILFGFSLVGILYCLFSRKELRSSFLLFAFSGILLSVPFAPTRDAGFRSYTVTNPLLFSSVFIAFPWMKNQINKLRRKTNEISTTGSDQTVHVFPMAYALLAVPVLFAIILPVLTVPSSKVVYSPPADFCEKDEIRVGFWTNRNAWIQVVPKSSLPRGIFMPYISPEVMKTQMENSSYHGTRGFPDVLEFALPGRSITWVPYNYFQTPDNRLNHKYVLAVVNTKDLPEKTGFISFCAVMQPISSESSTIRIATATNLTPSQSTTGNQMIKPQSPNTLIYILLVAIGLITLETIFSFLFPKIRTHSLFPKGIRQMVGNENNPDSTIAGE